MAFREGSRPLIVIILLFMLGSCDSSGGADPINFVNLTADGIWVTGDIVTGTEEVWYKVSVTGGHTYILNWRDIFDNNGTYSAAIKVSAFQENRSTLYFSEYATPPPRRNVAIPSGQSALYIKVECNGRIGSYALHVFDSDASGGITVTID